MKLEHTDEPPCCMSRGQLRRVPRRRSQPVLGYHLCCPLCGFVTLVLEGHGVVVAGEGHADVARVALDRHAEAAALVDALMQGETAHTIRKAILEPLEAEQSAAKSDRAAKAAATKVEFFTMARGEN